MAWHIQLGVTAESWRMIGCYCMGIAGVTGYCCSWRVLECGGGEEHEQYVACICCETGLGSSCGMLYGGSEEDWKGVVKSMLLES
eukprot:713602-Lingulodinium_polyedra.AAC.1